LKLNSEVATMAAMRSSRGFAALPIILLVLVVAAAAIGGYLAFGPRAQAPKCSGALTPSGGCIPETKPSQQNQSAATSTQINASGWQIYTNNQYGFEVWYPSSWIMADSSGPRTCEEDPVVTSIGVSLRSPLRYDLPGYEGIPTQYVLYVSPTAYGFFDAPTLPHHQAPANVSIGKGIEEQTSEYKVSQQIISSFKTFSTTEPIPTKGIRTYFNGEFQMNYPCGWTVGTFLNLYNNPILFCPTSLADSDPKIVCKAKNNSPQTPTDTYAPIILYNWLREGVSTSSVPTSGMTSLGKDPSGAYDFGLYLGDANYKDAYDQMIASFRFTSKLIQ
jgi:hypothetical protein